MNYNVVGALQVSPYVVKMRFRDGTEGEIDLEPELAGPIFEPLKDPASSASSVLTRNFEPSCRLMALTSPLNFCMSAFG
jgi:hypothetical protein